MSEPTMKRKTLRDEFAAAALVHLAVFWPEEFELPRPSQSADYAYRIADAMMERRKRQPVNDHDKWPKRDKMQRNKR
jgi:hypothetical protein